MINFIAKISDGCREPTSPFLYLYYLTPQALFRHINYFLLRAMKNILSPILRSTSYFYAQKFYKSRLSPFGGVLLQTLTWKFYNIRDLRANEHYVVVTRPHLPQLITINFRFRYNWTRICWAVKFPFSKRRVCMLMVIASTLVEQMRCERRRTTTL